MPTTVFYSKYYKESFKKATLFYDQTVLLSLVDDFATWKETGNNPRGLTDKPSTKNDKGVIFRPYEQNHIRHISFRIKGNGDPVLAFRLLPNNDVMIVCITTKHEMFGLKDDFVKKFRDEFPFPK